LPLHINTQVDLFADDTTLLAATDYNDINELNEKLSLEVSNVQNWAITIITSVIRGRHVSLSSSEIKAFGESTT
jgi:hypothetical protein